MAKIEIQQGDDWYVVKVDGKKRFTGHHLRADQMVTLLREFGHDVKNEWGIFEDDDEDRFIPNK